MKSISYQQCCDLINKSYGVITDDGCHQSKEAMGDTSECNILENPNAKFFIDNQTNSLVAMSNGQTLKVQLLTTMVL